MDISIFLDNVLDEQTTISFVAFTLQKIISISELLE